MKRIAIALPAALVVCTLQAQEGSVSVGQKVQLEYRVALEGQPVKGAPYSAEVTKENTQTLPDGNRIVQKATGRVFRDGEGRVRREEDHANGNPSISISDPVAGVSYSLDPVNRIAWKTSTRASEEILKEMAASKREEERRLGAQTEPGQTNVVVARIGDGSSVATVVRWLKAVGDRVDRNDPVCEVSAAGRSVQISAPVAGVITRLVAKVGDKVPVNGVIAHIAPPGDGVDQLKLALEMAPSSETAGQLQERQNLKKAEEAATLKMGGGRIESGWAIEPGSAKEAHNVETLTPRTVDGVRIDGRRNTTTLPAGAIGNEQPIVVVSEEWTSPELHVLVMTRHSDPRSGESTYSLTNIVRAEPDRSLFTVPPDYTVKETGIRRLEPSVVR